MMGGLGLAVGLVLAVAAKLFYVYVDPQIEAVASALPGANCGGCGLPGCSANAEAIVAGKSAPNSCVAAGPEVAEAIANYQPHRSRPRTLGGLAKNVRLGANGKYRWHWDPRLRSARRETRRRSTPHATRRALCMHRSSQAPWR